MSDKENKAIYINTLISHMVRSLDDTEVLLVLASTPSSMDDQMEYTTT